MHSSMMRTVHCSDRLVGRGGEVVCRGVSKWVSAVYLGVFAQRGCLPMGAGGVHPLGRHLPQTQRQTPPSPWTQRQTLPHRQNY